MTVGEKTLTSKQEGFFLLLVLFVNDERGEIIQVKLLASCKEVTTTFVKSI